MPQTYHASWSWFDWQHEPELSFGLQGGLNPGGTHSGFATTTVTQSLVYVWDPGSDEDGNPLATPAPAKVYFRLFGEAEASTGGHVQGTNAAALLAGAFSGSCTADDGLGDQAVVSGPTSLEWNDGWDASLDRRSKSSGTHLVQKDGSSGTITFTFNVSAHGDGSLTRPPQTTSNQAPPTMEGGGGTEAWPVSVQEDSRGLTISSSLGQTYHMSQTNFDSNGFALPDPDTPDSDGTVHANSIKPAGTPWATSQDPAPFIITEGITYHANVIGTWASGSSYQWHVDQAPLGGSVPGYGSAGFGSDSGTLTMPGDPPYDYNATYETEYDFGHSIVAQVTGQEHAYIHLTDANDGADATANYYIQWHDPVENWRLWKTGDVEDPEVFSPVWCEGDENGNLAYAQFNSPISGHYNTPNAKGGTGTGLGEMIELVSAGLEAVEYKAIPGWQIFLAAAKIGISDIEDDPKQDVKTATFDTDAWHLSYSTGVPKDANGNPDDGKIGLYSMRPLWVEQYQPQVYVGDGYGTDGYAGEQTEQFDRFVSGVCIAENAGAFVLTPSNPSPTGP